jgi:hypothetical protein
MVIIFLGRDRNREGTPGWNEIDLLRFMSSRTKCLS